MRKFTFWLPGKWQRFVGKAALFLLPLFVVAGSAKAQVSAYSFAASTGTYTPLTGGTPVTALLGDDVNSASIPLGFTFTYNGNAYTNVTANSNGWLSFAATPTTTTSTMRGNSLATTSTGLQPIIAPLWDDLMGTVASITGGTPAASYAVTGSSGSRIFTFEWLNWAPFTTTSPATISFQVKLYETTNVIEFNYRQEAGTASFVSASIGIAAASTNFISLGSAGVSPTTSITTSTNTITARPASGQVYTFSPPAPCTGTPTPGATAQTTYNVCSGSTQVLTVTGASLAAPGITYQWEQSPDGTTGWVNVTGGSGATTTSYTTVAYAGTAIYYRMKTTCTNSSSSVTTPVITVTGPSVPATQASAFTTTAIGSTTATLSWTNGNGNNRSVFVNTTNSFTDPVTPASPGTAATLYANTGQQLVYDGTATSVSITGLTGGTNYFVRVYENQKCTTPASWYYNVTTATNNPGSFTTLVPPVNDLVCNALELTVDDPTPVCVNTTAASVTASDPDITSCSAPNNTVWFKFTPTVSAAHTITASVPAASAKGMTAWLFTYTTAGTCPGALTFTAAGGISCGTATNAVAGSTTVYTTTALTAGTTYYIYVDGNSGGFGDICFRVSGPAPMSYTSSAVTQASTSAVVAGSINQQILRVAVTVDGSLSPLSLTQLDFNTNGTTDPGNIDSAKVFYTGTSATFSTTTQFGTTVADPNGAFSVTGSQVLAGSGTTAVNYFWLVYDVDCAATAPNVLDAECTSIEVNGPRTPTTPAPTGTRAIIAPSYTAATLQPFTTPVFQGGVDAQVLRVTLTGCANAPVTEINFNTNGSTNPATDIAAARVYYTPTTTFATTTQFGSDIANPNGAFTVNGSQTIPTGTGYFWLVYDLTAGALVADSVDASCTSAIINGITATPTTLNPTGKRPILAPITNDEATGAIALTVNSNLACGTTTFGTTASATQSADVAPGCNATGIDDDVWYTFVATGAAHRISYSAVSSGTMVAALYTGTPGSLALVTGACSSTTLDASGLLGGNTYYVRVFNTATTSATQSNFNICIGTPPPPPPNDVCANAVTLTVSNGFCAAPVLGTLLSADSTTGLGGASCQVNALKFDVWYKVTVPATGKVTVQTSAVNTTVTDLVLQAYSGSCGSLTTIGCDDDGNLDASPSAAHSKLGLSGRTPGEVIYFRVMPYSVTTNAGSFAICAFDTTASVIPTIAIGTANSCTTGPAIAVDSAYKYTWVSFKDASGSLVAQLYPNGNILGSTSASFYLNSGAVRQDSKGIYYLDRNVTIIPATQPTSAVTTRLYLRNAELTALATVAGATTRSQLNISKTPQVCAGSAIAADGSFITQSASAAYGTDHAVDFSNTSFSTFYLHKGTVALPITLVYFNGAKTNAGNSLNWKVNCTSVSVSFEIERSANGRNFSSIAALSATQARCATPFDITDTKPLAGVNYYRLKIIDVDGKVSYTNVVAINNKKSGIELVGIQPTLVRSEAILYIAAAKAGKLQIAVTDMVGRQIETRTISVIEGENKISLNFGTLAAGVYNLTSINESTKSTIRFVKE